MYQAFFGLRARPFGSTPSADLFFHSAAHRRALAWLLGQALAGEPLIVLTGDIGAGKTTVLQVFLRNLPDRFAPAIVVSTQLDEIELTRAVLLAFGAPIRGESLEGLRNDLRIHLAGLRARDRRGLVLVDEAQNLSASALRYLMRLPALDDDAEEGATQVIVSGQPGLQVLLVEAAGDGGAERLPVCRLGPMGTTDTGSYVRHRLRVVGTDEGPTFSADAIDRVQTATGGLPRLVNRLCDRVLMSACLDRTRDIDAVRVEDAAAELRDELGDPEPPTLPSDLPLPVQAEDLGPSLATSSDPLLVGAAVDSSPAPDDPMPSSPEPGKRPAPRTEVRRLRYWAAAAAAALLAVSVGWLGHDGSSPPNTARLDTAPPARVAAPRAAQPDAGPSARSATGEVRVPAAPPSQPMDARAALGLALATEPPPTEPPRNEPPRNEPPSIGPPSIGPPSIGPPSIGPPSIGPPSTEPTTGPPAGTPACNDATKALGLCP